MLLPDGRVFIMQGGGQNSYIFDPADLSFRQTLDHAAGVYSGFTNVWEGGKGLTNQSEASQPLVQIIRLGNQQIEWL